MFTLFVCIYFPVMFSLCIALCVIIVVDEVTGRLELAQTLSDIQRAGRKANYDKRAASWDAWTAYCGHTNVALL